jgi:hypothetical protein
MGMGRIGDRIVVRGDIRGFRETYICTGTARKKTMLAH